MIRIILIVEPTIQEEEEIDFSQLDAAIQESGKKLDAALSAVGSEDAARKAKIAAPAKKGAALARVKAKIIPKGGKTTGKKKNASGQSGGLGDGLNRGHGASKLTGDVISEEMNEESNESAAVTLNVMDAIVDPDMRTIEEFHKSTAAEEEKWEQVLDISGTQCWQRLIRQTFSIGRILEMDISWHAKCSALSLLPQSLHHSILKRLN